jgi:hypothetical protein
LADGGDDAVAGEVFAGHAEVGAGLVDVKAEFEELAAVEEGFEAFARGVEAFFFARGEFVRAAAGEGDFAFFSEFGE